MTHPQERPFQRSPLGRVLQRQEIKHILSLIANGNARHAVQGSILRTLLSSPSIWYVLEPCNRTRMSRRRKPCGLGQPPNSAWENFLGLMRPPLHEGAIMDTYSSLSQRLILSLTSDAGDFDSASAEWACSALGSNPHTSLCFQTSVLTLLAHKPSLLGILGPP